MNHLNNTIEATRQENVYSDTLDIANTLEENSIFQTRKFNSLSNKYSYISTKNIIDFLKNMAWHPVSANQVNSRKQAKRGYQKHLIKFENDSFKLNGTNINLILINSHDGSGSVQFKLGMFRSACSNGMIVGDSFNTIRLRHVGLTYDKIQDGLKTLFTDIPVLIDNIDKMKACMLEPSQILDMANKSMLLRFENNFDDILYSVIELIKPLREADNSQSAWHVFNTIQEKILNGKIEYMNEHGKIRKLRKVNSINKNLELNSKLFDIALNFTN